MTVGTELEISIGHRLMDYDGLCAHPHGHNYRVQVAALYPTGVIPGKGMYIDFKDLKTALKEILAPFDHAMMLRDDDPLISLLFGFKQAKVVILEWNPTAENFAHFIRNQLAATFPGNMWTVRVYETSTSYAEV